MFLARSFAFALLSLAVVGTPNPAAAQSDVVVVRDLRGTAHVISGTDEGAYFGAGYAAAQDRYFEMTWRRLMYLGQTAKYFGRPSTGPGQVSDAWVNNDRRARISGYERHADQVVSVMDPSTLLLLQAYVDGVNHAINSPRFTPSPLFATYDIPLKNWRVKDCIGLWLQFGTYFASDGSSEAKAFNDFTNLVLGGLTRAEAAAQMTAGIFCYDDAAVVLQSDVPPATQQAMQDYADANGLSNSENCPAGTSNFQFSHAWAVAGTNTTEGSAALVGDPRIDVFAPNIFYEWGMNGATFNVVGAGLPGCPNLLIGHTPDVAWSPTALGTDQADLFFLTVDEVAHPGEYELDGVWVPYLVDEVETIEIKNERPITVTYRETVWGPVITDLLNNNFGREYARKMLPFTDPTRDASIGFVEMYRADDVDELFAASEGWSFPSANLVMADSDGDIGYTIVGDIPVRHPDLVLGGMLATNGSITTYDWLELLPHGLRPHVLRPAAGRVFSANHMPVGSWYPIPVRFGSGSHGDSIRSRRLRELIEASPSFDIADVFAMHDDTVNPARRDVVELGIWLRDNQWGQFADADALAALAHLEPWLNAGATMDNAHYATLLASRIVLQFRAVTNLGCNPNLNLASLVDEFGGGDSGLIGFQMAKLAQIQGPNPTPLTTEEARYIEAILADAYRMVTVCMNLPNSNTWQNWYQNNALHLDVETWTTLGGAPSLEPGVTVPVDLVAVDKQTILSASAQSYTQLMDLSAVDRGQSVLPPGTGEGPGPELTNQLDLWENGEFKTAPLTPLGIRNNGIAGFVILSY